MTPDVKKIFKALCEGPKTNTKLAKLVPLGYRQRISDLRRYGWDIVGAREGDLFIYTMI